MQRGMVSSLLKDSVSQSDYNETAWPHPIPEIVGCKVVDQHPRVLVRKLSGALLTP